MFFGVLDGVLVVGFAAYFWRWNSNVPANKGFLCLIASCLGFANLAVYGSSIYLEPNKSGDTLIVLTNAYMRNYLIADLAAMLIRNTNLRIDMVLHHLLTITAYMINDSLAMAFVSSAEIVSVWEYVISSTHCCSTSSSSTTSLFSSPLQMRMRMVSIYPVRLYIWCSVLYMTRCGCLTHIESFFCVIVPVVMIPLDAFWYRKCALRLLGNN